MTKLLRSCFVFCQLQVYIMFQEEINMMSLSELCTGLPRERGSSGVSVIPPLVPERLCLYFRSGQFYDMWNRVFCHELFIVVYMISGRRTVNINDCSYTLEKGEVIIIPPYSKHFFGDEYRDFESLMASFVIPSDSRRLLNVCSRIWKISRKEDKQAILLQFICRAVLTERPFAAKQIDEIVLPHISLWMNERSGIKVYICIDNCVYAFS